MSDILDSVLKKIGGAFDATAGVLDKLASYEYRVSQPKDNVAPILSAIAYNETRGVEGDPYSFRKPSGSKKMGDDIGKYQVTSAELASWSKEFLGETVDPDEFHKDPDLQEAYMRGKVKALLAEGATTEEILALHREGLTGYADPLIRKKKLQKRLDYVTSGMSSLNQ